ncbi:MAG: PQQ-binding-like beta-propeller repeat protein [Opitutaceae bacterium]
MRVTLLLLLSLALRAVAADPAEGFWLGETVMERQRYQIGFEFRPGAENRIVGRQWFAVLHLFGCDIGEISHDGAHYRNANLGLDLMLRDGELVGTMAGANPVRLRRSEALLTTPVTPDFPQGPAPAWIYRAGAALWGTPAADGEFAVIGDERGVLHAVRLADGTRAWTFESGSPVYGRALLVEEAVLVLNDAGELLRLERATGKLLWRSTLGGGEVARHLPAATEFSYDFTGPTPALADGTVYVPTAAGDVVAVDFTSGETRWRATVGGLLRNSVLVAGDRLVVGGWNGRVTALARADGAKLWSFEAGQPVTADPVQVGGAVLVSSRNSKLYSLALADGTVRWDRFHAGSWVESAPRLVDGVLYIGSSDLRTVAALDSQTGALLWSTDVLGWTWGTPAIAGEMVFAGSAGATGYPISQDGGMVALDRRTGAPKWRVRLAPLADRYVTGIVGSPTVAGALVLFASQDGVLYALPTE